MLVTDRPVSKLHLQFFIDAGYNVPPRYIQGGLFYASKDGLIATATFGITKINIRCTGANREQKIKDFEELLERAITSA